MRGVEILLLLVLVGMMWLHWGASGRRAVGLHELVVGNVGLLMKNQAAIVEGCR